MSLIKWEPFGGIDDFFADFPRNNLLKTSSDLAVDVYEKEGKIFAEMNIPGMKPDEIDVAVEDNYLRITGSHKEEKEDTQKHYYKKEIRQGSFERLVALPCPVDKEKVEAEYENGKLCITMPKSEKTKGHKVNIKVK